MGMDVYVCEGGGVRVCTSQPSDSLVVCDVDPALTEKLRKFRFRKETNNAAILKRVSGGQEGDETEKDRDRSVSGVVQLRREAAASLTGATFVVYSYKYVHDDGRISYPLCFIFSSPVASTPLNRGSSLEDPTLMPTPAPFTSPPAPKVFEIRTTEDLTEEWLRERLAFFR
ncbi:hepatic lectin-like [Platysternon megacephalum]|uniref:Hepatic lectin-like n=1 Tax=Platysternon megacephalum TaxID=55544 RepID=A0A4D9DMX8_9SAUR|nr:hepatic lectin-like [Platysternon megacephalum]